MTNCLFVTDLHGRRERYRKLFEFLAQKPPDVLFMGGDLFPSGFGNMNEEFIEGLLTPGLSELRNKLGDRYPRILMILGNDDGRAVEGDVKKLEEQGFWEYIHNRKVSLAGFAVYGYSYVPPTPFMLKDWERYDVSRYVDPGCISPEKGLRTVPVADNNIRYSTIAIDLKNLVIDNNTDKSVFLFHTPPHKTNLDRAALDGRTIDYVPLDVHVGSIAVRRFIEKYQPPVTMHGHIHESARITGSWQDKIGRTFCFSAAHDGPELAVVQFDLEKPEDAKRVLL